LLLSLVGCLVSQCSSDLTGLVGVDDNRDPRRVHGPCASGRARRPAPLPDTADMARAAFHVSSAQAARAPSATAASRRCTCISGRMPFLCVIRGAIDTRHCRISTPPERQLRYRQRNRNTGTCLAKDEGGWRRMSRLAAGLTLFSACRASNRLLRRFTAPLSSPTIDRADSR